MRPGNLLGNHRQRPITLALVLEPALAHEDCMSVSAPLTHQSCSGLRQKSGVERTVASLELASEGLQASPQSPARPAVDPLLQLIGEGSDQQIATEPLRRSGAMQLPPGKPQFVRRPIHQFANLAVHLGMPAPPGRLVRAPPRPGTRDGPPECWRAKASSVGGFIRSPARRCGRPGRVPLWRKRG